MFSRSCNPFIVPATQRMKNNVQWEGSLWNLCLPKAEVPLNARKRHTRGFHIGLGWVVQIADAVISSDPLKVCWRYRRSLPPSPESQLQVIQNQKNPGYCSSNGDADAMEASGRFYLVGWVTYWCIRSSALCDAFFMKEMKSALKKVNRQPHCKINCKSLNNKLLTPKVGLIGLSPGSAVCFLFLTATHLATGNAGRAFVLSFTFKRQF